VPGSAAGFLPMVTVVEITEREGITEKGDNRERR
jgi:hypothetical protein